MELTRFGDRTSRGSVGVIGLMDGSVLTDERGLTAVTGVRGVRGSGLTIVQALEPRFCFSDFVSASMASELRITRK